MKGGRLVVAGLFAVLAVALAWVLFVGLPRWYGPAPATVTAPPPAAVDPDRPSRRIHAQLFYVAPGGNALTSAEGEVLFAEEPVAQAREILAVQLATPEPPRVSAVPPGTALRAVFITPRGEAYVDLTREVMTAHPGGSVGELLTVYTIVHALTANLRDVTSVQILVEGREVETLAGHVNLQRPLAQSPDWVR